MKSAFILFLVFNMNASLALAGWSGASADRNISFYTNDTRQSSNTRITVGPEGNLYAVWRQGESSGAREIYFSRSTDNGVSWSSETWDSPISAVDGQSVINNGDKCIGIDTDSQGNIYIVWAERLNLYREIMLLKSTDYGVTWIHSDADFNISFDGAPLKDADDPDIAIDSNDDIYVVWYQDTFSDSSEIHISISTDAGDNWTGRTADRVISFDDSRDASNPDIAIAPNDDIYVVWDEFSVPGDVTYSYIQYGKSTDGGATFNSEIADYPISTAIRGGDDAYLEIDSSGNVHVIWQGTLAVAAPFYYEIFYSRSTDGGSTWNATSGPITVDPGVADNSAASNPGLAITSDGNLIAVWHEAHPTLSNREIWASYSTDGGDTWSGNTDADLLSFPDGYSGWNPDIVAGVGDTLHVVWEEGVTSSLYYDVHYSKGDTLATGGGGGGGCDYVVGDVNDSGTLNGLDVTYGVSYFKGGALPPYECECTPGNTWYVGGDVNGSCTYNGLDITYLVTYFKGGSDPLPCADCPPSG
jgi:hypothetical protein